MINDYKQTTIIIINIIVINIIIIIYIITIVFVVVVINILHRCKKKKEPLAREDEHLSRLIFTVEIEHVQPEKREREKKKR